MSTRFVIFCYPRTGSYLFTDILNKQEGVTCHEEIFKKNRVELDKTHLEQLGLSRDDTDKRDAAPLEYLEKVFSVSPGPITGFKIFPAHNKKIITKLIYDTDVRKIFLARNPIQSYISNLVARASGAWTRTNAARKDREVQIEFSIDDFLRRLAEQRKFFERLHSIVRLTSDNPFRLFDYSEIKDPESMHSIAEFLGIKSWNDNVTPKYHKQIVRPYPEVVENWDIVRNFCKQLGVNEKSTFYDFMKSYNASIYPDSRVGINARIKHALKRSVFS